MEIEIVDYSLKHGELFAQVQIQENKPNPNFFNLEFDQWDVIESAIDLGYIKPPYDHDNGRNGQALRLGYTTAVFPWQMYNKELKKPVYFTYAQIEKEFDDEEREMIVRNLAMQNEVISNLILESII